MTNENNTITISFSGEEFRELEARAKEKGMPVEEYITRMIDEERKRDKPAKKGKTLKPNSQKN